jgi:hypothetical protein
MGSFEMCLVAFGSRHRFANEYAEHDAYREPRAAAAKNERDGSANPDSERDS